jgi:uncharacterized protein (DUF1697 family)
MTAYVVLIRGINVGGQNNISMSALKACVEELGHANVSTYLASGNVILDSAESAGAIAAQIEKALPERFKLDSQLIKCLALTSAKFKAMVSGKPDGFGDEPGKYHSDAIFLMGISVAGGMEAFDPREDVDGVWPGNSVIYHQRLSAKRTKTRLNKMMGTAAYKSMTIRSWATTTKLVEMLDGRA